ncbi:hypothetical protein GKC30_14455 [Pseudodesulfovibrio sp. F-1]|uniref:YcaO domain-containing protein n=1 Tax=Pseudodesulfovibrio alkaliphilus TaxID=2661613 RepID=A0A7K1KRX0_9BACT|nr:YcaO-like family protein [Pseudodesulfovibrio alkaliphilus]MUM78835.1 hypothetical protein [Pseudodesulfovibrio alkaliphilus]
MKHVFSSTQHHGQEPGLHLVVSPKTGVVKSLGHLFRNPGEPGPHIVSSTITAFHRFSDNKADFATTGTSLNPKQAHWSAMGESVERYCAALSDFQELVPATYKELLDSEKPALHPDRLNLFTQEQYDSEGFPFSRLQEEQRISWINGSRFDDGSRIFVPANFVFNQYCPAQDEARIYPDIHPGVASGFSAERALTGAMLEIVERDTMMIHWLNSIPVTGIAKDNEYERVLSDCNIPPHLNLHLAFFETDLPATCIFALLMDEQNGLIGGGCSAGFFAPAVARKATCEAIQILRLSQEVKRGERGRLASKKGPIPTAFLDPEARKKLPMTELLYNLGFYLDTDNWDTLHDLISPAKIIPLQDCSKLPTKDKLPTLVAGFSDAGLSPICVELTTPDVAELGWLVFRVIAPGAVPNLPTAYPPSAVNRLRTVPRKLGHATPEKWNQAPMPYA